jgi:uncharacterized protein
MIELVLSVATLLPLVSAQSFDCSRASTAVEKMVCADRELSRLDEEMARAFADARKRFDAATVGQPAWLTTVRNRCASSTCVKDAYEARVRYLRGLAPGAGFPLDRLEGDWTRVSTSPAEKGYLTIDSATAAQFNFTLAATLALSGRPITADDFNYRMGQVDGVAVTRAGTAVYRDADSKCSVTFIRLDATRLIVDTSSECALMAGVGVTFNGEYRRR